MLLLSDQAAKHGAWLLGTEERSSGCFLVGGVTVGEGRRGHKPLHARTHFNSAEWGWGGSQLAKCLLPYKQEDLSLVLTPHHTHKTSKQDRKTCAWCPEFIT